MASIAHGLPDEVHVAAAPGNTIVWLDETPGFWNGTIELAIKGRNIPQRSFVGVAFHGVDDDTYDAVYFRPFNFGSDDPVRRSHMLQYISHPEHTWQRLREEHPGVYESEILPAPDPVAWIVARIVVASPRLGVYVNGAAWPSLVVRQLSPPRGGRIGLWAGPSSDADFAAITVAPER